MVFLSNFSADCGRKRSAGPLNLASYSHGQLLDFSNVHLVAMALAAGREISMTIVPNSMRLVSCVRSSDHQDAAPFCHGDSCGLYTQPLANPAHNSRVVR